MRVFLLGASGVIGVRLVPLLVAAGHTVAGVTRTPAKVGGLRALGAEPVVCDVFDAAALARAMIEFLPDVVLDELTDLPDDPTQIPEQAGLNDRMRREGTRNVIAAARAANVSRIIAQSVAWTLPGDSHIAVQTLERIVLDVGGVVLRYGRFYGPGTYSGAEKPPPPRIHVDVAARRTVDLLTAPAGVIEVSED